MQTPQPQRLLDIDPTPGNPRNSEGSLVTLADGQLLFAYSRFVGGARDDSASYIACRRSPDGGSTWSDDETLVENVGTMNTMSVSFLRLRSGAIALFYLVRTGDERTGLQTIDLHMRTSVDEAATWSEAVCCTSPAAFYVVNNDRVIQLASGRLLAPAARHAFFDGSHLAPAHSMCFLSDDEGATWRGSATVLPPPEGSHAGLQEPGVIELTDGRVMMYIRTDQGCVYRSYSTDGGDTWSDALPTDLLSPVSPAGMKRIPPTGDILLLFNDHRGIANELRGRRTPLVALISTDEGQTWGHRKVIEDEATGWYCYTAIHFVGEDALIAYCAGDTETIGGLNRVRITRLPLQWLYG